MTKNKIGQIRPGQASEDRPELFYSFDLGLAAALTCAGFEILSLDKANLRKVQFVFRRKGGIEKVVDQYFADQLEVRARRYFDNLKALKNAIHSE